MLSGTHLALPRWPSKEQVVPDFGVTVSLECTVTTVSTHRFELTVLSPTKYISVRSAYKRRDTSQNICVSVSVITTIQGSLSVQLSTDHYRPYNLGKRTSMLPFDIIGDPSELLKDSIELNNNALRNHINCCA